MEIIRPGTNINFTGGRGIAYIVSAVLVVSSLLAYLFLAKFGVDFAGGTEIHVAFEDEGIAIADVRRAVASLGLSDDSVQAFGGDNSGEFLVRVETINFGAEDSYHEMREVLEGHYGADAFTEWVFDEEKDLKFTVVPTKRMDPLEFERVLVTAGVLPAPEGGVAPPPPADLDSAADAGGDDDSAQDDDDSAGSDALTADVSDQAEPEPTAADGEDDVVLEAEWVVRDARYTNGLTVALPAIAERIQEIFAGSDVLAGKAFEIVQVDSIGEKVGKQLRTNGILAILVMLGLILVYIAFRFELSFAPGAVIALLHDVLIVAGVFSLGCVVFGFEFNVPVIGALMTIVGYSLNDTIVVYDRIRENLRRYKRKDLEWVVNTSINECLSRTLLTSVTTFVVVLILAIFGGPILRGFAVALMAGILIGTYSSIYVASPVILLLQRWLPVQTKSAT